MQTLVVHINGLYCADCIPLLTRSLRAIDGARSIQIDVMSRSARVDHDEKRCSPDQLVAAIENVGFQVDGFDAFQLNI